MTHEHDDEEPAINSEVVWSFKNVHSQLLEAYPIGKALTETLTTVDGYEWQIEFFPNGTESNENKISVRLTLKNINDSSSDVDAQCDYYLINKGLNQNYVGKIARRSFKPDVSEEDADFDSTLLKECSDECSISFCIAQFLVDQDIQTSNLLSNSVEEGETDLNINDDDLRVESVRQLY